MYLYLQLYKYFILDKIISINKVCYRIFIKKENCIYIMYIEEDFDYIIYSIGKLLVMY